MSWLRITHDERCLCKPTAPCGERDTWCPLCRKIPPAQGCFAAGRVDHYVVGEVPDQRTERDVSWEAELDGDEAGWPAGWGYAPG